MCGRYSLTAPAAVLFEWFDIFDGPEFPPRYNIAPTQPIIVVLEGDGPRRGELMRWGLVPNWVKDPREFPLIINARAETILEKPSFRGAIRHHRCIIPATGYYEWRTGADGKKQPFYITMKDGSPMAFAGVWASWMGPEGEEIDSAAIVTVPASADLKEVHHRMPVMLDKTQIDDWLNVREVPEKQAYQMLKPLPEGKTEFHPVSTRVNAARDDNEKLIEEVTPEKPEPKPAPPKKKAGGQMDLF